jgi:hypothetical protein
MWEGVNCMHLAQDGERLGDLENTLMNVRLPLKIGEFVD